MGNGMVAMSKAMVTAVKKCLTDSKSHEGGKDETLKERCLICFITERIFPISIPAC